MITALLEDQLNTVLADENARTKIVMFTPYQRRGESVLADSYVFGRLSKSPAKSPYLTLDTWIDALSRIQQTPSVDLAKKYPIHILEESEGEPRSCKVFDCFGIEIADGPRVYILSSGVWYEVVSDFVSEIEDRISKIPSSGLNLPAWNQICDEEEYNAGCAAAGQFLNCDAKNFHFGGGRSQLEFCDLIHLESRTLVFSKIVSKSSGMSHLLEQVRRTADLLFSADGTYRDKITTLLAKHHPTTDIAWLRSRPRREDWNLCMVSLGRRQSELPFFAKCGLAKLSKDLLERGHTATFDCV